MSIEFIFSSISIQSEDLQEKFPGLIGMVNSYLPKRNTPKRRRAKKKSISAADKIQEIIDSIE